METAKMYELPTLGYDYNALEPVISAELLQLHHDKHHASYVKGANTILEKMNKARADKADFDTKATFKELSFHIGGHLLHSLFWENLCPPGKGGGDKPSGTIVQVIEEEFGTFERFKKVFSQTASSIEGSGWAALTFCKKTARPIIMQVEKHNANVYPMFKILMVLDVWEHAYYLDYKNDKGTFIEEFWTIVNWTEVNKRLEAVLES